jgi:branched-chain amino acid transport system substrate-binding protein
LLGKLVRLRFENDEDVAAEVVVNTLMDEGAVVLLGEVRSRYTEAVAKVAQQKQIPMISFAATADSITDIGKWIFRVCFVDSVQGTVLAQFAADNGFKTVAIFQEKENLYSEGLSKSFAQAFKERGGKIVGNESYRSGDSDRDFSASLSRIKQQRPEALFIPGYYYEVAHIASQARRSGLNVPLIGGDAWDSPKLIDIAGAANLEGAFFSNHYFVGDLRPENRKFVETYKARHGRAPDTIAGLGFDAASVAMDAIERANSSEDRESIRKAVAQTDLEGVSGRITLTEDYRSVRKPVVILQIRNGTFALHTTKDPPSN